MTETERIVFTMSQESSDEALDFYNSLSESQQSLLKEPSDVKLYGGCLGGGKSWQGNEDLSTVFPPPLEIEWIILDELAYTPVGEVTDFGGLNTVSDER